MLLGNGTDSKVGRSVMPTRRNGRFKRNGMPVGNN
ncbi:hypothetical protein A2U01_0052017, partial [Trifolium medium]|nr:hypothetical protein [Trifolium medium]